MNALARGRFVQKTILTRFCSSVHDEVITKLDEKDQKAGAEMKKDQKASAEMKMDQKAGAEMKKDQKAGVEMKVVITPVSGEAWVFVQADCPIVDAAEALLSKLKDQKVITEMKKVVTPIQGEIWVFVREDRPTIEAETVILKPTDQVVRKMGEVNIASSTAAGFHPMSPVMRKMYDVDISISTAKNLAQLGGVVRDVQEHGGKKVLSEMDTSTRLVDNDREKLYENADATRIDTSEMKQMMLEEFAEVKRQLKEMAASQKRGGSFGPKTGLKKGKGNGSTENGGENGGDENSNGNGGDAGGNGGDGGRGLTAWLKSLGQFFLGGGKSDED